jgi:23S rRNA maturation-related 3'-5' exoribonuclease YhaM
MTREEFAIQVEDTEKINKQKFLDRYARRSERLKTITEALENIGYFICPAAKSHHGNYLGGLWEHSNEVAKQLAEISICMKLSWEREDSPLVIGLLHDVCKTNLYKIDFDENKGDLTIGYNDERIIDGHGDLSVIMVQQHVELTTEEIMCIRYHMGAFVDQKEWQYYSKAVQQYPNVLWTHTADMIASQIMNT